MALMLSLQSYCGELSVNSNEGKGFAMANSTAVFGPAGDEWAVDKAAEYDVYVDRLDAEADRVFGTDEELGITEDSRDGVVNYGTGEIYDPESGLVWNGKEWEDASGSYDVSGGKSGGRPMKPVDGIAGTPNLGINVTDIIKAGAGAAVGIAAAATKGQTGSTQGDGGSKQAGGGSSSQARGEARGEAKKNAYGNETITATGTGKAALALLGVALLVKYAGKSK